MTARSNRSKSDLDPAQWVPPSGSLAVLCRYGAEWTATKLRWGLAAGELERDRLLDIAAGCSGTEVEFPPPRKQADRAEAGEEFRRPLRHRFGPTDLALGEHGVTRAPSSIWASATAT